MSMASPAVAQQFVTVQPNLIARLLCLCASVASASLAVGTVSVHGWLTLVLPATAACLLAAWLLLRIADVVSGTLIVVLLAFVAAVLARLVGSQSDGSLGRTVLITGAGVAAAQLWLAKRRAYSFALAVLPLVVLPVIAERIHWFGTAAAISVLFLLIAGAAASTKRRLRWSLIATITAGAMLATAGLLGVAETALMAERAAATGVGLQLPASGARPSMAFSSGRDDTTVRSAALPKEEPDEPRSGQVQERTYGSRSTAQSALSPTTPIARGASNWTASHSSLLAHPRILLLLLILVATPLALLAAVRCWYRLILRRALKRGTPAQQLLASWAWLQESRRHGLMSSDEGLAVARTVLEPGLRGLVLQLLFHPEAQLLQGRLNGQPRVKTFGRKASDSSGNGA